MANIRAQHCLQGVSQDPKDRYCNTFHFLTDIAINLPDMTAIRTAILNLFSNAVAPTFIAGFGNNARAIGETIKIYDLADPTPGRVPHLTYMNDAVAFSSSAVPTLPSEVSVCVSYEGFVTPLAPNRARRRGRLYLGPLNTQVLSVNDNDEAIVNAGFRGAIIAKFDAFNIELEALGIDWCVWSPSDELMVKIARVWVDDAFDIQRRRGVAPNLRKTIDLVTHAVSGS